MDCRTVHEDNLAKAGMTKAELYAKLREMNAFDLRTADAAIVESTFIFGASHEPTDGPKPDREILENLRRSD
jgi:hypothetical protein